MKAFLLRSLSIALILFVIFAASRALIRALPGNPIDTLVAETGTSISPDVLRAELGLDRPFWGALAHDLGRAVVGDLGTSILGRVPIAPLLARRFVKTLALTALALAFGLAISIALGLAAAQRPTSRADRFCSFYGALTAALPTPWIAPVLLYLFAVRVRIFPTGGGVVLPAITLALGFSGLWSRLIRERVRETLLLPLASSARARGIAEWKVLLKYGLAPSGGALAAYLGTQMGALLSGAFVTEVIFDWQGLGSLFVQAVLKRDYPIVEAAAFVAAASCLMGTFAGDWAQDLLSPWHEKTERGRS